MAKTVSAPKGRRVKCHATGAVGNSLTFYKAPDGHYYKDSATYQARIDQIALHKQLIAELANIMMFDPSMAFPTIVPKMLKELSFYGDAIILQTLQQCKDNIGYAMRTKEFPSEYQRASYVMAILKNHINDVYKVAKQQAKQEVKQTVQEAQIPVVQDLYAMPQASSAAPAHDLSAFLFDEE